MASKPETIAESLLEEILRGGAQPGMRLPREVDVASDFGVARGTVRSAYQALADRGIVTITHGVAGAVVRPMAEWTLFDDALQEAILGSRLGREVARDALELRRLLEPEAAALAAQRATEPDVEAIDVALGEVRAGVKRRAADQNRRLLPEVLLHRSILEAAHNRFMTHVLLSLEVALTGSARLDGAVALGHQERICEAVRAQQPAEACAAMRARLDAIADALPTRLRDR